MHFPFPPITTAATRTWRSQVRRVFHFIMLFWSYGVCAAENQSLLSSCSFQCPVFNVSPTFLFLTGQDKYKYRAKGDTLSPLHDKLQTAMLHQLKQVCFAFYIRKYILFSSIFLGAIL